MSRQDELKKKIDYCKGCVHCVWLISVGQGVRCNHNENQMYLPDGQRSPVLIGHIPDGCQYKELKKDN